MALSTDTHLYYINDHIHTFEAKSCLYTAITRIKPMFVYVGADSNVSKKKLTMSSNRETLDREPASPGEQVIVFVYCVFTGFTPYCPAMLLNVRIVEGFVLILAEANKLHF